MNKELNPMTFEEVGDVGTWGSGVVSEAEPVEKNQAFDSLEALRKRFLKKHVDKMLTVAQLSRLDSEEIAA